MIELSIAVMFGLALIGLSVRANARFRDEDRLPMQWSLTGKVNWTAPRALALAFTPVLGIGLLIGLVVMMSRSEPRAGQEGFEVPVLMAMGFALVAAHLLHLWLIDRTLRRGRG